METNETKIGIIHAGYGHGQSVAYYDLIFTTSRIVFSIIGRRPMTWYFFLGPIGALIALNNRKKKQEELANKSVEDILSLSEDNYSIPYSDIKSIQIKKILGARKVEIIANNEIKKFELFGKKSAVPNKEQIS